MGDIGPHLPAPERRGCAIESQPLGTVARIGPVGGWARVRHQAPEDLALSAGGRRIDQRFEFRINFNCSFALCHSAGSDYAPLA